MTIQLGNDNNTFPNNKYPDNSGDNTVYGNGGNDTLAGGTGSDRLYGGIGDDILQGGPGHDFLYGEDGNDELYGGQGNDLLDGGNGNDKFFATTIVDNEADLGEDIWYGRGGADQFNISRFDGAGYATIMDFNYDEGDRINNLNNFKLTKNLAENSVEIRNSSGNLLAKVKGNEVHEVKGIKFNTNQFQTNEDAGTVYINPILSSGETTLSVLSVSSTQGVSVSPSGSQIAYSLGTKFNNLRQNQAIIDTLNITLRDAQGDTYTIQKPVYIQGLNDTPTANSDSFTVNEDASSVTFDVLANDTDPDTGDEKYVISQTSNSAYISGNKIIYNPSKFNYLPSGQTGFDSFTYTMQDSAGSQRTATVNVTIYGANDSPNPVNDLVNVSEKDGTVTISPLTNDTDPDQGETSLLSLVGVSSSNASISGNQIIYTIPEVFLGKDQIQTETFTYTIKDPSGATRTANISVNISGINDAPNAQNDNALTDEDTIILIDVLGNDIDLDLGDTKKIVSVNGSNINSKVAILNNQIQYDPRKTFDGMQTRETVNETFTYVMEDSQGVQSTASVTVTVSGLNDSPVLNIAAIPTLAPEGSLVGEIVPDGSITDADNLITEAIAVVEVSLLNGTWQYFHSGQWRNFGSVSESNARLLDANNKIRFIPSGNETVNASFKYRAWDKTEGNVGGTANVAFSNLLEGDTSAFSSAFETVYITIEPPNPKPTDINLTNVNNPVLENQSAGVVIGTFSTVDNLGDSHSYQLLSGVENFDIVGNELRAKTSFDYEIKNTYAITVQSTDTKGGTVSKNFTVLVGNVNEAPEIDVNPWNPSVVENSPVDTTIASVSVSDPDGDNVTLAIILNPDPDGDGNPAFRLVGNQVLVNDSGDFVNANNPSLPLEITVSDGLLTNSIVTNVEVKADINTPPIFLAQSFTIEEQSPVGTFIGQLKAFDAEGDSLTYTINKNIDSDGDGKGAFRIQGNQLIVNDSDDFNFVNDPSLGISVSASDGKLGATANITVDITPKPIPVSEVSIQALGQSNQKPEGDQNITPYSYQVHRQGDLSAESTVFYVVSNPELENSPLAKFSSANATDFASPFATPIAVTFAPGEQVKQITVEVAGDTSIEKDEIFVVKLVNPSAGVVINNDIAYGLILDDDAAKAPKSEDKVTEVERGLKNGDTVKILQATDANSDLITYNITQNVDTDGDGVNAFRVEGDRLMVNDEDDLEIAPEAQLKITVEAKDSTGLADSAKIAVKVAQKEIISPDNLRRELDLLTDNAQQLEVLLKELAGGGYSEAELREIIAEKKQQAFANFTQIDSQLELSQLKIKNLLNETRPLLNSLHTKEGLLKAAEDALQPLQEEQAELWQELQELKTGRTETETYFTNESNKAISKLLAIDPKFDTTPIFGADNDPAKNLLQSSTEIQGIITRFEAARDHCRSQSLDTSKTKVKRDIFANFADQFDIAITDLKQLKSIVTNYENAISNGALPSEITNIKSWLTQAETIYAELGGLDDQSGSYASLQNKIKNQQEKWISGDTQNSIDVSVHINPFIEDKNPKYKFIVDGQEKYPTGKRILFIYKIDARVNGGLDEDVDISLSDIAKNIQSWYDEADIARQTLKDTLYQEHVRLNALKDTTLAEYDKNIPLKETEHQNKSSEIFGKQAEITNLKSGIGNINSLKSQIGNKVSFLSDFFSDNEGIVEDWKSLFRNQSHYFLDKAELVIYENLFSDWGNLLSEVVGFLTLMQQGEQSNVLDFYRIVEEYAEDLAADIQWVNDRSELVEKLGSANNDEFNQVLKELESANINTIPFERFADNLQTIKNKREDLLISYDDLNGQINQVNGWLANAGVYQIQNPTNNLLNRYIEQLEFTKERLSVAPETIQQVKFVESEFNQEIAELKTAWDNIKSTLSELVITAKDIDTIETDLANEKLLRISKEGDLGQYLQEKSNLDQKLAGLNSEINAKTSERSELEKQKTTAESVLSNLKSNVVYWDGQVDYYRNKEGGFFKWSEDADGIVLRTERVQNYKNALVQLSDAQAALLFKENEIANLSEKIKAIDSYLYESSGEKIDSIGRLNTVNTIISILNTDISSLETGIGDFKADLATLTDKFKSLTTTFSEKRADIQQQFSDIDFELSEQENLGDKLIGLGLLISEQDINFFQEIIYNPENPNSSAATIFKAAINNGDDQISGLNSVLQALQNFVSGQNDASTDAESYLDNFNQFLLSQATEITEWLNIDHPHLVAGFDDKLNQAKEALNDIQLGQRLRTLIQQGNLAEVIEAVTDRLTISEFTNQITGNDTANLDTILKLKEIVHQEVLDDIAGQQNILLEVNEANVEIQGSLEKLNSLAQQLFLAFDGKLPQALAQYLNAQDTLDLRQSIQAIVDARLGTISESVNQVNKSIDSFTAKIDAQKTLSEKIEGIDQELQLSDQAFAFIESQSQLNENTLTSKSLISGIKQLGDVIQFLINDGSLDSATVQQLTTAQQNLGQLTSLTDLLNGFETETADIREQLLALTVKEVDFLKVAVDYNARSNETSDLEDRLKRQNAKDKGSERQDLKDEINAIIDGTDQPTSLENRYFITPEADTWENLQKFAESVGGNLVTINGIKEQNFLKRVFARDEFGKVIKEADFWIGLNDAEQEGKWQWADGQKDNYRNWSDSTNTSNRDYVFMNQDGVWKTADGDKKLRGIIELDFNSIAVERLQLQTQLEKDLDGLNAEITSNSDYQTLTNAIETVTQAFEQAKTNAGLTELSLVDTLGTIRENYAESQANLNRIEKEISRRSSSAAALDTTANFYEDATADYLAKHEALKQEFAQKYGLTITDSKTWTETRTTWTRSLFGKKEVDVEITHVNTYWLYYKKFSKQAEEVRKQAADLRGENSKTGADSLNYLAQQKNTATQIKDAWAEVNAEADVLEGYIEQLKDVIQRIKVGDQQTPEYQDAINEFNSLLPSIESELAQAETLANNAYALLQQQWKEFDNRSDELQAVYDEVIPLKAEYRSQNLATLGDLETTLDWVELKNQSLEVLLESVTTVKEQLTAFLNGDNIFVNPVAKIYLEDALEYLIDNETLLGDRLDALNEHTEALNAQQEVLLRELELVDAYFDNGGKEFAVLKLQLDQAKSNLRELQSLAEIALDSSTVLTQDLNRLTAYLSNLNDERLLAVQESINAIQELINNINARNLLFGEAQEKLDNINDLQPQIIELLENIKATGETRAEKLLETAKNRGLAVAADIYYQDFSDLLTDTGNFLNGGIATEADAKLAKRFLKELHEYRSLKKTAEAEANAAKNALELAQGQQELLEVEAGNAQTEYDEFLAQIGDLETASDDQREKLYALQARQQTLANLQGPTLDIINGLLQVQGFNQQLAALETDYAEKLATGLSESVRQQYYVDALAKHYERQQIITQIKVFGKQDAYTTLQDSLIEIGRDYGLQINPILESTNNTQEIIALQEQLLTLEVSPRLPADVKAQLEVVLTEIDSALEGKESEAIKDQLTDITTRLSQEINQYQSELINLNGQFEEDQGLLTTAETDLKTAVETLLTAIETRNDYLQDKSILTDEVFGVLEKVRLADDANAISTELAKQARSMLDNILEQRQIERESRQISVLDFITDSVSTIITIASAVVSAGVYAGALAAKGAIVEGLRAGLEVASKVNAAVSAASNGDWSGALFNAIGATLTYLENVDKFFEGIEKGITPKLFDGFEVKDLTNILEKSYKALKTAKSGDALGTFLESVDALGTTILKGIDELSGKISLSDDFLKNFQKIPKLVKGSVEAIESGDWLDATANIFQAVITLANMRATNDFGVASIINTFDFIGNAGIGITDAIRNADITGWFSTVDQVLKQKEFYHSTQIKINEKALSSLGFNALEQSTLDNGKNVNFLALNGEIDPSKPTYVLTAGYLTGLNSDLLADTALLIRERAGDVNIVLVDWSEANGSGLLSLSPLVYKDAAQSAPKVGEKLGEFLAQQGVNPDSLHLIGHSLGAHVSGVAGRKLQELTGKQALEIVGLDPAGPGFSEQQKVLGLSINEQGFYNKLDKTDALNVIVVSSNSENSNVIQNITGLLGIGHYGINEELGHYNIRLSKDENKYYGKSSHGDSIQFFQQFLTFDKYNGNAKNLQAFQNERKDETISQSFNTFQSNVENTRDEYIQWLKDNDVYVGERLTTYKEPFKLSVKNTAESKQITKTGQNSQFDIIQSGDSFELTPKNYQLEQFLEIIDFDTSSLKLETSFDNGLTWEIVNPFDLNSKFQPFNGDRKYLITPLREGEFDIQLRTHMIDYLPVITLAIAPLSVTEDGASNLIYTVTRTGETSNALTVDYNVGGTATLGTDYTGISTIGTTKSVTFATGSSIAIVTVAPTADKTVESDETVALTLAPGTDYTIGTIGTVTGTILNDDVAFIISATNANQTEGNSGGKAFTFTVTRSGNTTGSNNINWAVTGTGTNPTNGADFLGGVLPSGMASFTVGETIKVITVNVQGDTTVEPNETFNVTLTNPTNGATITTATATATGTIQNDDASSGSSFTGTTSNNTLNGTIGADTLIGLAGNDTYTVNNAGDVVVENPGEGTDTVRASISYTLANNVENLILTGTDNLNGTGNVLNNRITGNSGNNILIGLEGNDILDGKVGADTMRGGLGNDTYYVDNTDDRVIESADSGTDTVRASIGYTLTSNVENLILEGIDNIRGTGNSLNNTITGNSGSNVLNGGTGADTMRGGLGNDTYYMDNTGDRVIESADSGTDTVRASISYTLTSNVENLILMGTDHIKGSGNGLKNRITGNTGNNILNGGAGADTLTGKAGNDTFVFRFGESTVTALDRITDFAIGSDKIDLLTQGGEAMNAPMAFTRAADSTTTTINTVVTNVFADADGATAGNQGLGLNSAALVRANTSTYLIVNDGTAGFQGSNDLVINLIGLTGTLPALGTIPVGNFFV